MQGELGTEVDRELATYGISPGAQGISDGQFAAAMEELKARRAEARVQLGAQDRERMDYMRATITAHVDRVGVQTGGRVGARVPAGYNGDA